MNYEETLAKIRGIVGVGMVLRHGVHEGNHVFTATAFEEYGPGDAEGDCTHVVYEVDSGTGEVKVVPFLDWTGVIDETWVNVWDDADLVDATEEDASVFGWL